MATADLRDARVRPLFPCGPGAGVAQALPGGPGQSPVPRRLFAGRSGIALAPEQEEPEDGPQKDAAGRPDSRAPAGERGGVKVTGADTPTLVPRPAGEPPDLKDGGAASLPPTAASGRREREPGLGEASSAREQAAALGQAQTALAEGQRDLAAAQAQVQAEAERYRKALAEIDRLQGQEQVHLESELVDLSIEIARQILLREIRTDRQHVVHLVEAALRVVVEEENAVVLVSPQDASLVEEQRQRLEVPRGGGLIRITADPELHPGDCVVQVGRARVDGRLMDRLERVRQVLHGADTETA